MLSIIMALKLLLECILLRFNKGLIIANVGSVILMNILLTLRTVLRFIMNPVTRLCSISTTIIII